MNDHSPETRAQALREVIAAIDRRVPQTDRVAEDDIARDAVILRRTALTRLAEIEHSPAAPAVAVEE